jgi:hypothetical protein
MRIATHAAIVASAETSDVTPTVAAHVTSAKAAHMTATEAAHVAAAHVAAATTVASTTVATTTAMTASTTVSPGAGWHEGQGQQRGENARESEKSPTHRTPHGLEIDGHFA